MGYYDYNTSIGEAEIMAFLEEFGGAMIGIVIAVSLLAMVWGIAMYVLTAVGFHTVAKRRGIPNPWLAWIPIADAWLLGSISDQFQYVTRGKVTNRRKILLGLSIGSLCFGLVVYIVALITTVLGAGSGETFGIVMVLSLVTGLINVVLSITNLVFTQIALYDFYTSAYPENNVLFLVLGIVFAFLRPFFVFFNRKLDRGMPPRKPEYRPDFQPQPNTRFNPEDDWYE